MIVPATRDAKEEDTELKPVKVKSSNVGLSSVSNPRLIAGPLTPFVFNSNVPCRLELIEDAETIPLGIFSRSL